MEALLAELSLMTHDVRMRRLVEVGQAARGGDGEAARVVAALSNFELDKGTMGRVFAATGSASKKALDRTQDHTVEACDMSSSTAITRSAANAATNSMSAAPYG